MDNKQCDNTYLTKENKEIISKNDENKKLFQNNFVLELIFKIDLNNLLDHYHFLNNSSYVIAIHELSNKNFGILLSKRLTIISPISFKTIKTISPFYEEMHSSNFMGRNDFIDFIELNNNYIIIWTSNVILFYDNEYNLVQKIDEYEYGDRCERVDDEYGKEIYYEINSIRELKNGKLISCNSYGLKFYEKNLNLNKYELISTVKMEIDVDYVIEIKPNVLILLQKHYDESIDDMEGVDKYLVSIYNIEDKSLKEVFRTRKFSMMGDFHKVNYIISNKYLYVRFGDTMEIFDLENNMENITIENIEYKYETNFGIYEKIMKKENRIKEVLSTYNDYYFFGKDNEWNLNLYSFYNNNLNICHHFEIKDIVGVIKSKNNDIIIYSSKCELYKFQPIFSQNNK